MDKFFKTIFVTILLFLLPVTANAECRILIDGDELSYTNNQGDTISPFVFEGTTYVPLRAVGEAFDLPVSWDNDTRTVHIGTVGGSPSLSDEINIYYNGEEFKCYDVNSNPVYPKIENSSTYLPIRAIGELFGKTVTWDNVSKTAVLTTAAQSDAIEYFADCVANTDRLSGIKTLLTVDGTISYDNRLLKTTSDSAEPIYSQSAFTLSSFLSSDYSSTMSYLGDGKYFLALSSDSLVKNYYLNNLLNKRKSSADISMLYITCNVKGGYITDFSIDYSAVLSYNNLSFDENYSLNAFLVYPDDFKFLNIPLPEVSHNSDESKIPIQTGPATDYTQVSNIAHTYVNALLKSRPADILALLSTSDYNSVYSEKSKAQYNSEINNMKKQLSSDYKNATGEYSLTSLVYIDFNAFPSSERAAKVNVTIEHLLADEYTQTEIELKLYKSDGTWYLALSSVSDLIG